MIFSYKKTISFDSESRPSNLKEKQTDPPNFGKAKRIPLWLLKLIIKFRIKICKDIISRSSEICNFIPKKVSIIVLSCKRYAEFKRLCESMVPFFRDIENYDNFEIILVDNGSGKKLVDYAEKLKFFNKIIKHPKNLGMANALNDIYQKCNGEYIMLIEDDMIVDYSKPFLSSCIKLLNEFPEIGIIRLKNQNNWGKPFRIISSTRKTSDGLEFWTWLPSLNRAMNVWACGCTLFRKVSFMHTGLLPVGEGRMQASLVENTYGKLYNKTWLAAKIYNCYPVFQPNDNEESPGFNDRIIE